MALGALIIGVSIGLVIDLFSIFSWIFIGPNTFLTEKVKMEIKNEIVEEALEQIQEYRNIPYQNGNVMPVPPTSSFFDRKA